ncbi:hypothetical protein CDO52_26265 [Nocardiopsis gilva YIM 90087]|uniref:Uncharacterized protein n=1 Tax=Nocardiopsis gilva YIM 90087 TaxID=1235441 RepID=A0A223SCF7_9ACTN|nr:hypothetical protein CDO52_26265 [Nocardiopsis gilva YIM 90087]
MRRGRTARDPGRSTPRAVRAGGTFGQHKERELGFEVEAVERYDDRTVLRFITTAAGRRTRTHPTPSPAEF